MIALANGLVSYKYSLGCKTTNDVVQHLMRVEPVIIQYMSNVSPQLHSSAQSCIVKPCVFQTLALLPSCYNWLDLRLWSPTLKIHMHSIRCYMCVVHAVMFGTCAICNLMCCQVMSFKQSDWLLRYINVLLLLCICIYVLALYKLEQTYMYNCSQL